VTLVLVPTGSATRGSTILLDDDEQHHLRVRRVEPGAAVRFTDGAGVMGEGHLASKGKALSLDVHLVEQMAPLPAITLGVAAGDRDRFGWLVEKATELGVTGIVALDTDRTRGVATAVRPAHVARFAKRAREALKQCGGAWAPLITGPVPLADFVRSRDPGARWLMDASGGPRPSLQATAPARALVGPEGGLTEQERALAIEHHYVPVGVGPYTLRFETAAVSAAVLIQSARAAAARGT
jgi:16S rRNA (uracil1498-N3)-methyltransferase